MEKVILVDELDHEIGVAEKLEAHQAPGRLHRAFSILIFDPGGRMLLQRRAAVKYHFGGLWTNACCGHPRPGEELVKAARRRMKEELGRDTELRPVFSFRYTARDEQSGLTEDELDHVLFGELVGEANPNPDEIDALRWVECDELVSDVKQNPEIYTPWFRLLLERLPEVQAAARPGSARRPTEP
jgi:isopentenyl-diphosphate delta-isomerase